MIRRGRWGGLAARCVLAAAVLGCAVAASAQDRFASPRYGSFQLSISGYHPRMDTEFGGTASPYSTVFGNGRGVMGRLDVAYTLIANYGTLDVGAGIGFFQTTGHGFSSQAGGTAPDPASVSPDLTKFRVLPTRISVTYRFDMFVERYPIPLAPYVRFSLDRYWWWVTNGSGSTSKSFDGRSGSGATNGYSFTGGVALLLNFLDPQLARDMDRNSGINQTYLFVEFTKSYIDNFGSATSWDISDDRWTLAGGLLFVF